MTNKLKKLNEIFMENAPCHSKIKLALEDWKKAYEKRRCDVANKVSYGDDSVIKFIEHLCDDETKRT